MANEALKRKLMFRYGTAPSDPTDSQLGAIRERLRDIQRRRPVTESDLNEAVTSNVPSAGQYQYASRDDSDVNDVLDELIGRP